MATFFSRRYIRRAEAVGRTERVLGVVILLLTAGLVGAFILQVTTDAGQPLSPYATAPAAFTRAMAENPFPDPDVEGWRAPARVSCYTPDDLYVKIDGRAEAFLKFHVAGLVFGTYYDEAGSDRKIDVYWYDMGEAANASGMYRSEASPDAVPVSISGHPREAELVGGAVFFWKGTSYVQVLPARVDQADVEIALKIAGRVAERIEPVDRIVDPRSDQTP